MFIFRQKVYLTLQHSGYRYVTMYTKTHQGNWKVGRVTYKQAPSPKFGQNPYTSSTIDYSQHYSTPFRPARSVGQA